jgi:glucosamine--fructose-6-phosphate aminotransferase (isomerizing)
VREGTGHSGGGAEGLAAAWWGSGRGEFVVASDASAIVAHTTQAFPLDDYNVVKITRAGFRSSTVNNVSVNPKVMQLEMDLEQIELGRFDHFMQKEIHEQPASLRNTMRGRLQRQDGKVVLGGLANFAKELTKAKRVTLVAQGHSAARGDDR